MSEVGDRAAFLGRIRARQGPAPVIGPHPPPPAPDAVPAVRYRSLDGLDPDDPEALVPVFVEAAEQVGAHVHRTTVDEALADVVARHRAVSAVVSSEPEAQATREHLIDLGVAVDDYAPDQAAEADLGVTSAVAAVAATGSVVVDSAVAGGRAPSLLPRVHVCVVPVVRLVATPSDVLRSMTADLPSARTLVTGPSRTGDIEQIITLGVHGPLAVEIVLL